MKVLQYTSPEFAADCVSMYVGKARHSNRRIIRLKRLGLMTDAARERAKCLMYITCARFWSLYVKGILK